MKWKKSHCPEHTYNKCWILLTVHALVVKTPYQNRKFMMHENNSNLTTYIKSNINIIYCLFSICTFLFIYFTLAIRWRAMERCRETGIRYNGGRMVYAMINIFCSQWYLVFATHVCVLGLDSKIEFQLPFIDYNRMKCVTFFEYKMICEHF